MKIRIELDAGLTEEEIVIRTARLDDRVSNIQRAISDVWNSDRRMAFYKGESSYYLPLSAILFFETEGTQVYGHTGDNAYLTKHRLYELEEMLPGTFMRVSKSCIVNVRRIYALTKSLTAGCTAKLSGTHKEVYISRQYYKPVRDRLEEKR